MGASSTRRKPLAFRFPRYAGPRPHRFRPGGSQPQRATKLRTTLLGCSIQWTFVFQLLFSGITKKKKTKKWLDYFHLTKEFFDCAGTTKGEPIKLAV
jgi:hypothetical protein